LHVGRTAKTCPWQWHSIAACGIVNLSAQMPRALH